MTDEYDDVVTTHTEDKDYPHSYVNLTDEGRSQEYYQNPGATLEKGVKGPTSEYAHIDDGKYINDGIEMSHAQTDNHPHT